MRRSEAALRVITTRLQQEGTELREQVRVAATALGQSREELQALSRHLILAQEEERCRIARELHDDLGQRAALLSMSLDQLEADMPAAASRLDPIRAGLAELSVALREVSHRLHPAMIGDLGPAEALNALIREFQVQGLDVHSSIQILPALPLDTSTTIYRIAQEGLRNVALHAPASAVRVSLTVRGKRIVLTIADQGPGFDMASVRVKGGLGLISMNERARLVGGDLVLRAIPGKGTTVRVRLPLPK